jgi:hypothetical protein
VLGNSLPRCRSQAQARFAVVHDRRHGDLDHL